MGAGHDNFTIQGGIVLGSGDDLFSINTSGDGDENILISGNVVLGNALDTFFVISQSGNGNNSITIDGSVTAGKGDGFMTLGASGTGTDVISVTGPIAYGTGTDSLQITGGGAGHATFNLLGGVTGQGYDTYTIEDPGAISSAGESLTVNGNLGGGAGNNTFIVTSGLNNHAGVDAFVLNGNLQGGAGFNTFSVTDSGLATNSFTLNGAAVGGANDLGDVFQFAGLFGTVNLVSGSGAGGDTYEFSGGVQGTFNISDPDQANRIDTLDFSTLNTGVNVNLGSTAVQTVAPGLTLHFTDANGFSGVIGSPFSDTVHGNARSDSLAGSDALDNSFNPNAPGIGSNGKVQVVLLDFDTATEAAGGVYNFNSFYAHVPNPSTGDPGTPLRTYTTADRLAVMAAIEQDYAPFVQAGAVYFTLDPKDPKLRATNGDFITEFFNQSVPLGGDEPTSPIQIDSTPNVNFEPGGTSNDLDFRDADMNGQAFIQVNGILGEPLQPPSTDQNWVTLSSKIAAHELGHLLGLHHADSFGPIGQGIMPLPGGSNYNPAYTGPYDASETFDHIITSGDSVGADRWNDLRDLFFGEREDVVLAYSFTAPTTPADGTLLVSQHGQPTVAAPQQLSLQSMLVPNTEAYGRDAGKTFEVQAVDVLGTIGLDSYGNAEKDYYTFTGTAGDVMNINVMSSGISRYLSQGTTGYIDPQVTLYRQNGDGTLTQVAFNDDVFPASASGDSSIVDFVLPASGAYVIKVNSFAFAPGAAHPDPSQFTGDQQQNLLDAINGTDTGNYELFIYRFQAGVATSGNDVFIPGTGLAAIVGGAANADNFTSPQAVAFTSVVGDSLAHALATFTSVPGGGNYSATINWGDGSSSAGVVSIYGNQVTILSNPLNHQYAHAGTYRLTIAIDQGVIGQGGIEVDLTSTAVVNKATPSYSALAAPAITYGATRDTISGKLSYATPAGALAPTGNVSITVNGVTQVATIAGAGSFSTSFDSHAWHAATYNVTFHFGGDADFVGPTDGTTSLLISPYAFTYQINIDSQTYGTAANLGADLGDHQHRSQQPEPENRLQQHRRCSRRSRWHVCHFRQRVQRLWPACRLPSDAHQRHAHG